MARRPGIKGTYEAFDVWRDECLLADGAMFSDEVLWTLNNIQELGSIVEKEPPTNNQKLLSSEKLKESLQSASPEVARLAAETIWLLYLGTSNRTPTKKRNYIEEIYKCSGKDLPDSPYLTNESLDGIAGGGEGFNLYTYLEFVYLLRLLKKWKTEPPEDQEAHWDVSEWLDEIEGTYSRQSRNIILHFLFPRYFETAASKTDREKFLTTTASNTKMSYLRNFRRTVTDFLPLILTALSTNYVDLWKKKRNMEKISTITNLEYAKSGAQTIKRKNYH